ncbi:MAG TPA: hypothetical protein VM487_17755 [Phycisphaerae bacterium]|nr:hypothetical protein [Phycisphaerae bacterium]
MPAASPVTQPTFRRALSIPDILWWLLFFLLLLFVVLPGLFRSRGEAKRAVCSANLRGIGQGMHIYANDFHEWFPHHYYEPTYVTDTVPAQHGVRWGGTMGSNDFLRITEETTRTKSPDRSHPSRSLFLLVIAGMSTAAEFICPKSSDNADDLRNRGSDSYRGYQESAAQPGRTRFDFRGYDYLSYGYQLPYARRGKPRATLDVRVPIAADKGPYYESAGEGLAGTGTIRDRRSHVDAPQAWSSQSADEIRRIPPPQWRPYNSRNHGSGEGQNVLFVDSHVEFLEKPIVGVHYDNIYTLQNSFTDPRAVLIGMVPDADQAFGPLTNTDSFIVP